MITEFDREDVANMIFAVKIITAEKLTFYPLTDDLIKKLENWHCELLDKRLKSLSDNERIEYLQHLKRVEDLFCKILEGVEDTEKLFKELKKQNPGS